MGRGSSGAGKTGGKTKYVSADKTFTEEGTQYIVGVHNFRRTPSIDKGQVLVAGTDNKGNLVLQQARPMYRGNLSSTESPSLFSLRHGITNLTTLDKEPKGQPQYDGKTSYYDFLKTSSPKVGSIQSFGIDWNNVKSVRGETYGVREYIKQKGFKWNAQKERWEK